MTLSEAIEQARREPAFNTAQTLHATSDGSFWPNANPDNLLAHAKLHGLEIHPIKGDQIVEQKVKPKENSGNGA